MFIVVPTAAIFGSIRNFKHHSQRKRKIKVQYSCYKYTQIKFAFKYSHFDKQPSRTPCLSHHRLAFAIPDSAGLKMP